MTTTPTLPKVKDLLLDMQSDLTAHLKNNRITDPCMVGIHSGGAWLAMLLHKSLGLNEPLGELNISFYRDDFSRNGLNPQVAPSQLPFSVEDRHIILVDDVVMSGRTVRAALNELFDFGRPASITLAALIELDARELPIRADIVGKRMRLADHERIKLRNFSTEQSVNPHNLGLEIQVAQ